MADVALLFLIQIRINAVHECLVLRRHAGNFVPAPALLERDKVLASKLVWNDPHCLFFGYDAGGRG